MSRFSSRSMPCFMSRWFINVIPVAAVILFLALGSFVGQAANKQLVVYTYDSFASSGPANHIVSEFKKTHPDVDVVFIAVGDAGEALARLVGELETGGTSADVFVGISDTQLPRALARNIFTPFDPKLVPNLADVPAELHFDTSGHVIPLDHGYVSLVYNKELISEDELPQSLEELTDPRYKNKIIVIDPRTSSPGHAFLMWTIAKYGDPGFVDYWRRLAPNLLTVTSGWSEAYQYFEAGEVPIIVSYTTDTAYAMMYGAGDRQQVLTPEGEAYRQIEGAGIVAGTENFELAHEFLNLLLSVEVQSIIPTTNWMFPVNDKTPLPAEWDAYAIVPEQAVHLDPSRIEEHEARWLRQWATEITR